MKKAYEKRSEWRLFLVVLAVLGLVAMFSGCSEKTEEPAPAPQPMTHTEETPMVQPAMEEPAMGESMEQAVLDEEPALSESEAMTPAEGMEMEEEPATSESEAMTPVE
ncbi:MAG: hypothetical protein KKA60_16070 [Proteobacteria bacterium]|nr:hypothetical protein [Pseudomonadota bacterium]